MGMCVFAYALCDVACELMWKISYMMEKIFYLIFKGLIQIQKKSNVIQQQQQHGTFEYAHSRTNHHLKGFRWSLSHNVAAGLLFSVFFKEHDVLVRICENVRVVVHMYECF